MAWGGAAAPRDAAGARSKRSRTTSDFEILRPRDSASMAAASGSGRRTVSVFTPGSVLHLCHYRKTLGGEHKGPRRAVDWTATLRSALGGSPAETVGDFLLKRLSQWGITLRQQLSRCSVVARAAAGPVERLILPIHRHHPGHAVLRLLASAGPRANGERALRGRARLGVGSGAAVARLGHF